MIVPLFTALVSSISTFLTTLIAVDPFTALFDTLCLALATFFAIMVLRDKHC